MSLRHSLLESIADGVGWFCSLDHQNRISLAILERLAPIQSVERDGIRYSFYSSNRLLDVRARTLFSKEPDVIAWIDTFRGGDILFDVGANIGLFTIYAAKRGSRVVSFEPEAKNYAVLNSNISLNGLEDRVSAFSVALSDRDGLNTLYLSNLQAGGAEHNLGQALDWRHRPFSPRYRQSVVSFSIDSFVTMVPEAFPTHIKIDVDGVEATILSGCRDTLRDRRLKSVLVEINENLAPDLQAIDMVQKCGLAIDVKTHLFQENLEHNVYNYVFRR